MEDLSWIGVAAAVRVEVQPCKYAYERCTLIALHGTQCISEIKNDDETGKNKLFKSLQGLLIK